MRALLVVSLLTACSSPPSSAASPEHATPPSAARSTEPAPAEPRVEEENTLEPPSAASWAELCPVLADTRPIAGSGPSLAGPGVTTDLEALVAALPEAVGGWARAEQRVVPRGTAGTASPYAMVRLMRGDQQLRVELLDLVHVCRCEPGDGARLRARALDEPTPGTPRELGGHPARLVSAAGVIRIDVWVQDRCKVTVEGPATEAEATSVAEAVDWARVASLCAR